MRLHVYTEWITRSVVNKAKEGGYVRIFNIPSAIRKWNSLDMSVRNVDSLKQLKTEMRYIYPITFIIVKIFIVYRYMVSLWNGSEICCLSLFCNSPLGIRQTVYRKAPSANLHLHLHLLGTELCLCRPLRSGKTIALRWRKGVKEWTVKRIYNPINVKKKIEKK